MQYTRRVKSVVQLIPTSSLMFLGFLVSLVSISQGQQVITQVASVGENLTLSCYPPRNGYAQLQWERKRGANIVEYLVNINTNPRIEDTLYNSGNSSFSYYYNETWNETQSSLALYLTSADIGDSGKYTCKTLPKNITRGLVRHINYDVRVIGCTCSEVSISNGLNKLILCDLSGYVSTKTKSTRVELNEKLNVTGQSTYSKLIFSIQRKRTVRIVRFNPYQNVTSQVSCSLDLGIVDETLETTQMSGATSTKDMKTFQAQFSSPVSNIHMLQTITHGQGTDNYNNFASNSISSPSMENQIQPRMRNLAQHQKLQEITIQMICLLMG